MTCAVVFQLRSVEICTFLSPETALLLVSTKNRDFWPQPLARSNTGSPRFTDFPSLCACSESSLTNLIGSGLNLLCLQIHSKLECRWTWPEVAILGADQKARGLWGRDLQCSDWVCAVLAWVYLKSSSTNWKVKRVTKTRSWCYCSDECCLRCVRLGCPPPGGRGWYSQNNLVEMCGPLNSRICFRCAKATCRRSDV